MKTFRDFPGSPVAKNPLANVRDMGSIPGPETEIPHILGQLSPVHHKTESMLSNERSN